MLMWVMSDRAIPRSYRMMQGFGVHTFRMVNERGESVFVKFHWNPVAGTHSLDWDEAVKISGADPDFHRRDLWEAIEAGAYPGVGARPADLHRGAGREIQLRRARRHQDRARGAGAGAAGRPHGAQPQSRQLLRRDRAGGVLHRAHRAGPRLHERSAARGPHSFVCRHADLAARRAELPRDPDQRAGGAGAQQPARRHASPGDPSRARVLRAELARRRLPVPGRRARLHVVPAADRRRQGARQAREVRRSLHAGGAVLQQPDRRWSRRTSCGRSASSSPRCRCPRSASAWCRSSSTSMRTSRKAVAEGLGIDVPDAAAGRAAAQHEARSESSPPLSLFARPGDGSIRTRCIAMLVAHGVDGAPLERLHGKLADEGAVPRFVGLRLGTVRSEDGRDIDVEVTLETAPSVVFDAVVIPDGEAGVRRIVIGRPRARIREGSVPALQDRSLPSAPVTDCWMRPNITEGRTPDRSGPRTRRRAPRASSPRLRSIVTSNGRPIRRACESRVVS